MFVAHERILLFTMSNRKPEAFPRVAKYHLRWHKNATTENRSEEKILGEIKSFHGGYFGDFQYVKEDIKIAVAICGTPKVSLTGPFYFDNVSVFINIF